MSYYEWRKVQHRMSLLEVREIQLKRLSQIEIAMNGFGICSRVIWRGKFAMEKALLINERMKDAKCQKSIY